MATLETSYGWVAGDQVRLLIASGLTIGRYQIDQITVDMNTLGELSVDAVTEVRLLLDNYESAQSRLQTLNTEGDNRILVKADVLEWEQNNGIIYDPNTEIQRVRKLLYQYFGFSILYGQSGNDNTLYRS